MVSDGYWVLNLEISEVASLLPRFEVTIVTATPLLFLASISSVSMLTQLSMRRMDFCAREMSFSTSEQASHNCPSKNTPWSGGVWVCTKKSTFSSRLAIRFSCITILFCILSSKIEILAFTVYPFKRYSFKTAVAHCLKRTPKIVFTRYPTEIIASKLYNIIFLLTFLPPSTRTTENSSAVAFLDNSSMSYMFFRCKPILSTLHPKSSAFDFGTTKQFHFGARPPTLLFHLVDILLFHSSSLRVT